MGMSWTLLVGALVLVGCPPGDPRGRQGQDTGGMTGQMDSGMGHMDSGHMGGGMNMSSMRAHMDTMMRVSPQQMHGMMARHEQMMSQMIDGMGADMRGMNMSGSPEWTALTDSVKQDLAELPSLKDQQLSTRMRAHASRVQRLIDAHEQMMKTIR
jgi:hypothetical protein